MRAARFLLLAVLLASAPEFPVAAARPAGAEVLSAAPLGPIVEAPDGKSEMELVRFDGRVTAKLQALAPEETLRVDDWPVSPGRRAQVVLRRFDVYAPDAKIVVIENGREIEVPRSRTVFFMGAGIDGWDRFAVGLDPDTGLFRGSRPEAGIQFEIRPREDGSGLHQLAARTAFDADGTPPLSWACGQEELPLDADVRGTSRGPAPPEESSFVQVLAPATRVAIIAVETDNEFMNLKFGNNAAAATTYIAALFAAHNVIYVRDVNLQLLQGYTILRPSTTADPYVEFGTDCNPDPNITELCASSSQLSEFRTYWNNNYASVRRALAMMLSGKQTSNSTASGIATLNVLCASSGYSFTQVFKFAQQTASNDIGVVAHEVGHNMSSPHTHCYADPKPDVCYNGENCYSGSTACPADGVYSGVTAKGTLMSYCHVLGGCSKADVFHTSSLTRYLNGAVAGAPCLFAIGAAAPTLTNVAPASGPIAGGTVLTLTGTNFVNGPPTVAFVELPTNDVFGTPSSKAAASVTFNSSTQLTVTTPSATNAGAVDVVVMNPDFQTATRASGFTYSSCSGFVVSDVSPKTGPAGGNTLITLSGCGFLSGATVTVGGAPATSVSFVGGTALTARTPARPIGPADVVVTNPGGASALIPGGFLYTATGSAPRLNTITPCRLIDTRNAAGPFGGPALVAGVMRSFTVSSGSCGVPSDAAGVSFNATVADATMGGSLVFFPGSGAVPGTATIEFLPAKNRANNVTMGLVGGVLSVKDLQVSGTVNVIVDVNGYYR